MFLDEATIHVRSGRGGPGCVSFRREKYLPKGGPDGGSGGGGGSVYLRASAQLSTLLDIGRRKHYRAGNGGQGMGNNRTGRRGRDLTVDVPVGTTVREVAPGVPAREGPLLGDLVVAGEKLCVARGGRGGRGNKTFATSTRQVPRFAGKGEPGEERELYLELKLLADVGLVGLPNAGKSTLLSRVSAATPKVADYPFTTLQPNLGIAEMGDYSRLVLADIPGLIEGAHRGHGLGIEFLRHIERTRVIVHLLSSEETRVDRLEESYRTIETELRSYSEELARKPRILVLSKVDLLGDEDISGLRDALSSRLRTDVLAVSSVTGRGIGDLLKAARDLLEAETGTGTGTGT